MYLTYFCVYVVADLRSSFGVFPKYFLQNVVRYAAEEN